jgi:hypothetical protein
MHAGASVTAALVSILMAGCADFSASPTSLDQRHALFGKAAASQDIATTFTLPNDASLALRGDGKYLNLDGQSEYANGVCGISSKIFIDNGGGDAIMYTSDPKHADRRCINYPRNVFVGGETNALVEAQLFLEGLNTPGAEIPVGESRDLVFAITPSSGPCGRYNFAINPGGDRVSVTRTAVSTWVVRTKPAPNNRAICMSDGSGPYAMDISFTIQAR